VLAATATVCWAPRVGDRQRTVGKLRLPFAGGPLAVGHVPLPGFQIKGAGWTLASTPRMLSGTRCTSERERAVRLWQSRRAGREPRLVFDVPPNRTGKLFAKTRLVEFRARANAVTFLAAPPSSGLRLLPTTPRSMVAAQKAEFG